MEPVEGTERAFSDFERVGEGDDIRQNVTEMGELVRGIVPECVGMSLTLLAQGLTFTLVATDDEVAALDAAQYLRRGPCVDAVSENRVIHATEPDFVDDDDWQFFARAAQTAEIASTLSLPVSSGGEVIGGVNLYASTATAFDDRIELLAASLGSPAESVLLNRDLNFETRLLAAAAPQSLADLDQVSRAAGMMSMAQSIGTDEADQRLLQVAARAGISRGQAARAIMEFLEADHT